MKLRHFMPSRLTLQTKMQQFAEDSDQASVTVALAEVLLPEKDAHEVKNSCSRMHVPSLSLNSAATKLGNNSLAFAFSSICASSLQLLESTSAAACCGSLRSNNATVSATALSCVSLLKANGGGAPMKLTLPLHLQRGSQSHITARQSSSRVNGRKRRNRCARSMTSSAAGECKE